MSRSTEWEKPCDETAMEHEKLLIKISDKVVSRFLAIKYGYSKSEQERLEKLYLERIQKYRLTVK